MTKYEQELLSNCSRLDAVTNAEGKITGCAQAIINNNKESTKRLCKYIENVVGYKDPQITRIAIAVKDSLIKFYGYLELSLICSSRKTAEDEYSLEELLSQLNSLVGLENVKSRVNDLIAFQKVQLLRKNQGLRTPRNTMHLAFTGNPGTGKTTVARIVGRVYKQLGLLSRGHFTEVSRTDLIAGYQGQTALKVKKVVEKAKGGVLFIDEAYSITENDHSDSYGRECLTELTKALEDYRDDLVVIVAGYTEPMKMFFEANPGLKSRFNTFVEFDDFNSEELLAIIKSMCKTEDYNLISEVEDNLKEKFSKVVQNKNEQFANGRFVRNIFEDMVINHARRVSKTTAPSIQELKDFHLEDIPSVVFNC